MKAFAVPSICVPISTSIYMKAFAVVNKSSSIYMKAFAVPSICVQSVNKSSSIYVKAFAVPSICVPISKQK